MRHDAAEQVALAADTERLRGFQAQHGATRHEIQGPPGSACRIIISGEIVSLKRCELPCNAGARYPLVAVAKSLGRISIYDYSTTGRAALIYRIHAVAPSAASG